MLKSLSAALLATSILTGCATVTIRPSGGEKIADNPDYEQRKNYFFWGLAGEHSIDVAEICAANGVEQVQSQHTFGDRALGAVTLGIYAPKTAKVWCNLEGDSK
jgi:hypothetical protein